MSEKEEIQKKIAELQKRLEGQEIPKPEKLDVLNMEFDSLIRLVSQYIDYYWGDEYCNDDDFKDYIFDKALETVYGKDIWSKIKERRP